MGGVDYHETIIKTYENGEGFTPLRFLVNIMRQKMHFLRRYNR